MDSDLDPFADILPQQAVNNVRVAGKFQPRAKLRPGKTASTFLPRNAKENTKSEPLNSSTQFARVVDLNSDAVYLKDESLQLDFNSFAVPNSSISEDNKSKEPISSSLGTLSVAKDSGNDNDGLCLHELDSVDAVDVGSLGTELDPFADVLFQPAVDNASVGGKFKPKAKIELRKGASEATVLPIPSVSENPSVTTLENLVTREPLKNEDNTTSGVILSSDPHSSFEKPIGENADIYLGLEYFHDLVTQSPNSIEIPVPTSNVEETEQQCGFPTQNSGYFPVFRACNTTVQDPVSCNEPADLTDDGRLQSEESGPFFNVEQPDFLPDSTTVYESYSRKFQPKPKVQNGKEKPAVTNVSLDVVGTVAPPTDSQFITSETGYESDGVLPAFPSDGVFDYSSMSFRTTELPMDEEQTNIAEASQSSDANIVCQEDIYGVPENKSSGGKKKKSSAVSNPYKPKAGKGNEGDKSSRHMRKRTAPQIVEEPAHDNDNIPSEAPSTSVADDDNDYDYEVDEDNRPENTSQKNTASKKSKIPGAKKQNPGRRRKRENDTLENSTQVPQKKKFSHSTRRKNRLKELLSIPEDEVDFQRLPFKDVILLAGHKESLKVKEAKATKNASTGHSSKNAAHGEESLNEEGTSEQDGGYIEDQSKLLFNHNSFMDKTPRSRWSKQDTELFYEGISQFGTDLSMIQQLFPGKTRHQIKLKFKKEERQQPLRLHEALNSRSKDNSYFEKVIEHLKHVAAKAEHESNKDGSAGASDEEAELNPETQEDTAKMEQDEDIIAEDQEEDVAVESPKYDEDDMDVYNSYETIY